MSTCSAFAQSLSFFHNPFGISRKREADKMLTGNLYIFFGMPSFIIFFIALFFFLSADY